MYTIITVQIAAWFPIEGIIIATEQTIFQIISLSVHIHNNVIINIIIISVNISVNIIGIIIIIFIVNIIIIILNVSFSTLSFIHLLEGQYICTKR